MSTMALKKWIVSVFVAVLLIQPIGTIRVQAEQPQDIYCFANKYYRIKSVESGKYLLGNSAGYEAQAAKNEASVFYMKPSDLGIYIFYDQDSKWLNINYFNAIVRNQDRQKTIQWQLIDNNDGTFSIFSVVKKKYVCVRKTSLKWSSVIDDSSKFIFEETRGNNPFPEADVCVTITDSDGNEIDPSDAMSRPAVGEPIIGYADTHCHINHYLGSGQAVFAQEAFDPLGIEEALGDCTHLHGINGSFDLWGVAVDGKKGHDTSGYPNFGYWPTSYSTNHQQTYYKWIERSYLAGQRVLVQQCVNNETLGKIMNAMPPYKNGPTDDMEVVDLQLDNIYKMQDYIDAQCGGPGKGWFRVVTDAEQARKVISEGKMAVFLSMEVDTVFNADTDYIGQYKSGELSKDELDTKLSGIEEQLEYVYNRGVRSFFPIHAMNNGFGGCQLYQGEIFSIMNYLNRQDFYQPEVSSNPRVFYKQPKANLPEDAQGHANSIGLTETGEWLIGKMMDKHMSIEIDHLSDKALNQIVDIAWEKKYPGLIASHTRILDMFDPEDKAWEQMDIPRMIKVMQLGGIISPMLWETQDGHQKCVSDYLQYMIELSSNKTQTVGTLDNPKYQKYGGPYQVPTTWYNTNDDPSDDIILGIPYGSDVNGACMLPNFDKLQGVYDDVDYDDFTALNSAAYNSNVASVKFDKQVTGNRTFDINGDRGVAHYGLIPDFWEKMQSRPDRVNVDATFNSAEAYIRMWERIERYSDTYPSRDPDQWPLTTNEYWHD